MSTQAEQAQQLILKCSGQASALAAIPVPVVDVAASAYVQVKMVNRLAEIYGAKKESNTSLIIGSLVSSVIARVISDLMSNLTRDSQLANILSESVLKSGLIGLFTKLTGEIYKNHFSNGGSLNDMSFDDFTQNFKLSLQSDELSVQNIVQNAIGDLVPGLA